MKRAVALLPWLMVAVAACSAGTDEDVAASADAIDTDEYGFTTEAPTQALADTYYAYDLRTNIGRCATDRAEWTIAEVPAGAKLVVKDRESAKVEWDLGGVAPGKYAFAVKWRAWTDCGALRKGSWAPEVTQTWTLEVRPNHWYSGDLHVHTKHSERDDSSGSVYDYYQRAVNGKGDDQSRTFASRSRDSLRGRLHWMVFSDHSNNEKEECGRHFTKYCKASEKMNEATGRDVVQHYTEESGGDVLLVQGSEISNEDDGHFGFLPLNPFPNHPIYAPGYGENPTKYDADNGYGPGVFRERWVDPKATNAEELALIHELGGLAIVNHEDGFYKNWVKYDWSSLDFDGLEVWNGGNRHDKWDDSAYNGGIDFNPVSKHDELTVDIPENPIHKSYIGMLKHGKWPFALVGGSDAHDVDEVVCGGAMCDPTNAEVASPMTTVWADDFVWTNGKTGVVDGIKAGRVVVHDTSNFIDLRIAYHGKEYMLGDTIDGYVPGDKLHLRAFGHTGPFVDGDNRVLLMLGTNGEESSRQVNVHYSSEDATHFVKKAKGKDHMRYIRPESSFDRQWDIELDAATLGAKKTYFVWSQFIPWHDVAHFWGNGRDMAQTGVIRVVAK